MFFKEDDRKLLRDLAIKQGEQSSDIRWIKDNFSTKVPDNAFCTKNIWKQRLVNILLLCLICGVVSYPEAVKVLLKGVFKWIGT